MRRNRLPVTVLVLAWLFCFPLYGEPVFVKSDEDGQGMLRSRQGVCYLITPAHVLGEARQAQVTGGRMLQSQALLERMYEPDLAIMRVTGEMHGCDLRFADGQALERLLAGGVADGYLLLRSEAGTVRRTDVTIQAFDERFLRIIPEDGVALMRGMSGSTLYLGGTVGGMLLSVNAENQWGTVLRQDYLNALVSSYFPASATSSRPNVLSRDVIPTLDGNDVDGFIAEPAAGATSGRAVIRGDVQPVRPVQTPEK